MHCYAAKHASVELALRVNFDQSATQFGHYVWMVSILIQGSANRLKMNDGGDINICSLSKIISHQVFHILE